MISVWLVLLTGKGLGLGEGLLVAANAFKAVSNRDYLHVFADDCEQVKVVRQEIGKGSCVRGDSAASGFVKEEFGSSSTRGLCLSELQ